MAGAGAVTFVLSLLGLGVGALALVIFDSGFSWMEAVRRAGSQAIASGIVAVPLFYAMRYCLAPTGWVREPRKSRRSLPEDHVGPSGFPVARRQ